MLRAFSAALAVLVMMVAVVGCGSQSDVAVLSSPAPGDAEPALGEATQSDAYSMEAPRQSRRANAEPASRVRLAGEGRAKPAGNLAPHATPALDAQRAPVNESKFAVMPPAVDEARPYAESAPALDQQHRELESEMLRRAELGGDRFDQIVENGFVTVRDAPLSTFSIDVDTASYAKTRMYLQQRNALPPPDAVRIEELVNYFDYDYSPPAGDEPFAVHMEIARAPWKPQHLLARVGIKGREVGKDRASANLVFLIDVSGSMNRPNKLGLVKQGLQLLTTQLHDDDRVSIVVYAGAAGLVLPPTQGDNRHVIMDAIERLAAGGSTNGGEGIRLAYEVARQNFVKGGVNRVLLCTDGDFNVGTTNTGDLVRLAESQAREGVFLTVLGFGMGNHNDAMLEQLSNKANGNYAFIDSDREAQKVLLDQLDSTLVTIAKDVKIQIEFNPAQVASYRLIGYENRRLADRDFNDDKKDAGEIGAGHTVTALYELVLADGTAETDPQVDPLKYQTARALADAADSDDLLNLKLRFKRPDQDRSELLVVPVKHAPLQFGQASLDFQFAAAVAEFGMLLRNSQYRGDASYAEVLEIAASSRGNDRHGYRSEFLQVVNSARRLAEPEAAAASRVSPVFSVMPRFPVEPAVSMVPQDQFDSTYSLSHPTWSVGFLFVIAFAVWLTLVVIGLTVTVWALLTMGRRSELGVVPSYEKW